MQTLETKNNLEVQRLSEVAQSALVTLIVGEQIGEDELGVLQERRIQFGVLFGGKLGKFYLDDVVLYPKLDKLRIVTLDFDPQK